MPIFFACNLKALTIKKELRFILLSMEFSICETLRKILSNSLSFSKVVSSNEAEA